MSNAAPPTWVRELSLPSGAWRCLVGLWGFAKYGAEAPAQVWPARETLALATGQKPATVAKQLRKLADLRWILRAPNGVLWLAWRIPWSSGRIPWSSDTPVSEPTTTVTGPNTPVVASRRPQSSHNLQEPSKEHSSNVEVEARDPHDPGHRSQGAKSAQPERERSTPKPSSVVSPSPSSDQQTTPWGSGHVLPPHVDPWPARVRVASESAHYHLAMSDGPAPSYGGLLTQAVANYGAERVLLVLRAWEADEPEHRPRPPANKLWWKSWTSWVERELGITAPKPEATTKRSPNGQAALDAVMAKVEARRLAVVP